MENYKNIIYIHKIIIKKLNELNVKITIYRNIANENKIF